MQGVPTIGADGSKREYGQRLLDAGCSHWRPVQDDIPIPGTLNIINLACFLFIFLHCCRAGGWVCNIRWKWRQSRDQHWQCRPHIHWPDRFWLVCHYSRTILGPLPSNLPYSCTFQLRETLKEVREIVHLIWRVWKLEGTVRQHHAMTLLNRKYQYRRLTYNCRNNINYRVNFWGNYNINYWVNNRRAGRDNRTSKQQERGYRTIRSTNTSRGHSRFRRIMKNTFETCRNILLFLSDDGLNGCLGSAAFCATAQGY